MGGKTYVAFDVRGNDIINITSNNVVLGNTYAMRVSAGDSETTYTWYYAYLTINRANLFIEALEEYNCEELLGSALYHQYVAEAKFIRALSYYYLCQLYSQPYSLDPTAKAVPLRLVANKGAGNNDCPRSTISEIYSHILTDVSEENIQALPATTDEGYSVTFASKAAALMLKMRVNMAMGNWSQAIEAGESITGYSLPDNVTGIFNAPYYNEESIFSLPMTILSRPNTQQSAVEYYMDGDICIIDYRNGVMSKTAYSLPEDKRVAAFAGPNDKLLKFTDSDKIQWIPIFRYAETLLNLAECYARDSQTDLARNCLAEVRRRSIAAADDILDLTSLSGEDLIEAIEYEKRLELIGEGIGGIELISKGRTYEKGTEITAFTVDSSNYTWPIPSSETAINSMIND